MKKKNENRIYCLHDGSVKLSTHEKYIYQNAYDFKRPRCSILSLNLILSSNLYFAMLHTHITKHH